MLDVGCASGYLAAALNERGCTTYGVEPDGALAAAARTHCARVFEIDVETPELRGELPGELDAVILGDVLEHLRDPWEVLASVGRLLRPGGVAVVSVPNGVHWRARREIARGRFPLEDSGTFDRTHLRWFTLDGARDLARTAGPAHRARALHAGAAAVRSGRAARRRRHRRAPPLSVRSPALVVCPPRRRACSLCSSC